MAIYLDEAFFTKRDGQWLRLTADDERELHEFAACSLVLNVRWFSYPHDSTIPVYHITDRKRDRAVQEGARVVPNDVLTRIAERLRRHMAVSASLEYEKECLRLELASVKDRIDGLR